MATVITPSAPADPMVYQPQTVDINSLNAQAQSLYGASMMRYGTFPNPRLAVESLVTQSTPSVIQAINQSPQQTASLLSNSPLNGSTPETQSATAQQSLLNTPVDHDPYSMTQKDWSAYWNRLHAGNGYDKQWQKFDQMPIANLDWVRAVMTSDAGTIKKWQSYLNQMGQSSDKIEISGVWDKTTDSAFRNFLISRFTPDAAYGDESTRNKTTAFLSAVSNGQFNADTLSNLQKNPQFRTDMVIQWMFTHGPDEGGRDAIREFADRYGKQNVPDNIANLEKGTPDNPLSGIPLVGGALGIMTKPLANVLQGDFNPVDFGYDIPLVGSSLHYVGNTISKRDFNPLDINKSSEEQKMEQEVSSKELTDHEQQALAPALQMASEEGGPLGNVLNGWNHYWNQVFLTASYYTFPVTPVQIPNFVKGFKGFATHQNMNPFDASSVPRRNASAFQDDPMSGLLGSDFKQRHPLLDTIGNIGVSIADDPTTYIPYLGEAGAGAKTTEELAKFAFAAGKGAEFAKRGPDAALAIEALNGEDRIKVAEELRKAAGLPNVGSGVSRGNLTARWALASPKMIRDSLDSKTQYIMDWLLRPQVRLRQEMSNLLGQEGITLDSALKLLKEADPTRIPIVKQILEEKNPSLRYALLEYNYGPEIHDVSFFHNYKSAVKAADPQIFNRLSQGKQINFLLHGFGGRTARSTQELLNDPIELLDSLTLKAQAIGMPKEKYDAIVEKALSDDPNDRRVAVDMFREFEHSSPLVQKVLAWKKGLQKSRYAVAPSKKLYQAGFNDAGKLVETSMSRLAYRFKDDPSGVLSQEAESHVAAMNEWSNKFSADAEQMVHDAMEGRPNTSQEWAAAKNEVQHSAEYFHKLKELEEKLQDHREAIDALGRPIRGETEQRPMGFLETHMPEFSHTLVTPYDVLAYSNPVLRNAERVQSFLPIDQAMAIWKRTVLAKPSSSLRISMGDEYSRFAITHLLEGGPQAFWRYLKTNVKAAIGRGEIPPLPDSLSADAEKLVRAEHGDYRYFSPDDAAFAQAAKWHMKSKLNQSPLFRSWIKDMVDGKGKDKGINIIKNWLQSDEPAAKDFLRRLPAKPTKKQINGFANEIDAQLREAVKWDDLSKNGGFFGDWAYQLANNTADEMGKNGEYLLKKDPVGTKKLQKYVDEYGHDPTKMPLFVGRDIYNPQTRAIGSSLKRASSWFQSHVTGAMVQHARRAGYASVIEERRRFLQKAAPYLNEHEIEGRAINYARHWVKNNTYQMERSMLGTALRNAFPFWGATANFNRFVMRTLMQNPALIKPSAQLLSQKTGDIQSGDKKPSAPLAGWMLSMMGATAGDDVTWDPSHAFFFTADGLGSSIPGIGPVFTIPLNALANANPDIAQTLSTIPGLQFAGTQSPTVPWAQELIDGFGMAVLHHPITENWPLFARGAGYYERKVLQKEQEQHAAYEMGQTTEDTSVQKAQEEVGKEEMFRGVLSGLVPLGVSTSDKRREDLRPALQAFDKATTPELQQQVMKKYPNAAPLLQYYTAQNPDDRRGIVARNPWVQSYATGMTASSQLGTKPGSEPTAQAYYQDLALGHLRYLQPAELIDKMQQSDQLNVGWGLYTGLNDSFQSMLQQTGLSSNSAQAQQWKQMYFDQPLQDIFNNYPAFRDAYALHTSNDVAGLSKRAAPLNTLAFWNTLPRHDSINSQTTTSWRQVMLLRDNAATALREMQLAGSSQAEQLQVLEALKQNIAYIASQDPVFAQQIKGYRFSSIEDVVKLEQQEMAYGG